MKALVPLSRIEKAQLQSDLFWVEKVYGKSQYDILLMGDSRTYEGVSPKMLRNRVPRVSIYNFGFFAAHINEQLLKEAEKRLRTDGKRFLIFSCTSRNLMDLKNEHFFSIHKPTAFSRIFPVCFIKQRYQKSICGDFGDNLGFSGWKRVRDEAVYCEMLKRCIAYSVKRLFTPSDFKHFVQNLKWCKRNNIKVVAYRMVSCREMDELEDKLSGVDWNKIKQAVLDEGFVWLERPPSPLLEQIEEHCWDASHLNAEGAELFSNWLGQELAKLDWFKEDQQTSETKK